MVACFVEENGTARLDFVFAHGRKEEVAKRVTLGPEVIGTKNLEANKDVLRQVEVVIGTWESPVFTAEQVRA